MYTVEREDLTDLTKMTPAGRTEGWQDSIIGSEGQKIKRIFLVSSSRKKHPAIPSIPALRSCDRETLHVERL